MENENIKSVVDNAFVDNAAAMRDSLYNAINDKIFAALEARKQEIAQNLINSYDEVEDNLENNYENGEVEEPEIAEELPETEQ